MVYLHPALGALAVALLLWSGMQGLRARHRARYAAPSRAFHRRLTPWMFALVVTAAVTGLASVALLREDLGEEADTHMYAAWTTVVLLGLGAYTSRRFAAEPRARTAHRWMGFVAMLLGLVVALLGIRLLP